MNCRPRSSAVLGRMGSRVATAALLAGLGLASAVASPKAGAASPNAGAASPNTISVPCDGAAGGLAGLQAAITSADAKGGGRIALGDCTFSVTSPDTIGADGPIALPAVTAPITILGNGSQIAESGAGGQLIEVDSPGSLTARDLALSGGYGCSGGAIGIAFGASATLVGVTMTGNSAGGPPGCSLGEDANTGGAIANLGKLTVRTSVLSNNGAAGFDACGGAIFDFGGTVTVTDTEFSANTADGYAAAGGAVCDIGGTRPVTGTFSGDTFTGNSATPTHGGGGREAGGGAVFSEESTEAINRSSFSENSAVSGGAVFTDGDNGTMLLSDDLMNANSASLAGGAATDYDGTTALTDDTLSGNEAEFGTAILSGGNSTLTSDTIVGNRADTSQTGTDMNDVIDTAYLRGTLTLAGTLIAANNTQSCYGLGVTDGGYNIADDASCDLTALGSTNDSSTIDSELQPLGDYGGPTETLPTLVYGQIPARNALCTTPDQRGVPRTSPLGCDIGAFQSIFTATFLSAPNRVPARRAIKLKATVTGNYSKSTGLGGMVTFLAGSTVLGTVAPNKRGVATLTLAGGTLSKGTYWCSASFSGPVGYHGSASAAVPVIVG